MKKDTVTYLFVDLAARYSAAVLMSPEKEVLLWDVVDFGHQSIPPKMVDIMEALDLVEYWAVGDTGFNAMLKGAEYVVVEDAHLHAINPKPVLRAQAVLLRSCYRVSGVLPQLVSSLTWQRYHGYKYTRGLTSKSWAKGKCLQFGFDSKDYKVKGKAATDLRDSYLGCRWMVETQCGTAVPEVASA